MSGGSLIVCGNVLGDISKMQTGGKVFVGGEIDENPNIIAKNIAPITTATISLTNERIFFLGAKLLNLPLEMLTSTSHSQINPFVLLPLLLNSCEPE